MSNTCMRYFNFDGEFGFEKLGLVQNVRNTRTPHWVLECLWLIHLTNRIVEGLSWHHVNAIYTTFLLILGLNFSFSPQVLIQYHRHLSSCTVSYPATMDPPAQFPAGPTPSTPVSVMLESSRPRVEHLFACLRHACSQRISRTVNSTENTTATQLSSTDKLQTCAIVTFQRKTSSNCSRDQGLRNAWARHGALTLSTLTLNGVMWQFTWCHIAAK